jgi:predicted flap endonuclease-1-like 5' DNA nuclease
MSHLALELLLWIVFVFFVGCIVGCILRRAFGPEPELVVATAAGKPTPVPKTSQVAKPAAVARSETPAGRVVPAAAKLAAPPTTAVEPLESAKPTVRATPAVAKLAPPVVVESAKAEKPKGIAAPRSGKPDNLKLISGIGAKIERTLHELGVFHFDQIASWTAPEVQWVDEHLKFKGRIARDDWQGQASRLAGGKTGIVAEGAPKSRRPARKRVKKPASEKKETPTGEA